MSIAIVIMAGLWLISLTGVYALIVIGHFMTRIASKKRESGQAIEDVKEMQSLVSDCSSRIKAVEQRLAYLKRSS